MKNQRKKSAAITVLFITAAAIITTGISFTIYSLICNQALLVLNTRVHGAVFGLAITFLGIRYLLSVSELKAKVYSTTDGFSFRNFKRNNTERN